LIRSRTRLRELAARSAREDDPDIEPEMRRILEDALESVTSIERVTAFAVDGTPLLSVGSSKVDPKFDRSVFECRDSVGVLLIAILSLHGDTGEPATIAQTCNLSPLAFRGQPSGRPGPQDSMAANCGRGFSIRYHRRCPT
jgi:hypothetical protein